MSDTDICSKCGSMRVDHNDFCRSQSTSICAKFREKIMDMPCSNCGKAIPSGFVCLCYMFNGLYRGIGSMNAQLTGVVVSQHLTKDAKRMSNIVLDVQRVEMGKLWLTRTEISVEGEWPLGTKVIMRIEPAPVQEEVTVDANRDSATRSA